MLARPAALERLEEAGAVCFEQLLELGQIAGAAAQ